MFSKKLSLLLSISTLVSCSSTNFVKDLKGVKRVKISQAEYLRPQFFIDEVAKEKLLVKKNIQRGPASAESTLNLSNRELYFLTLYKQYKTMASIVNYKDDINSCPSFHNVLLENKKLVTVNSNKYSTDIDLQAVSSDSNYSKFYPVLALPSGKSDLYSQMSSNNWKNTDQQVEKALNHYLDIEKKELKQLCDRGVSGGYYIFENLVTYFGQDEKFHATQKGVEAFSKVPVIANMMILNNLTTADKYASESKLDHILFTRTKTFWFKNYINHLDSNRKKILSRRELNLPKSKEGGDVALNN